MGCTGDREKGPPEHTQKWDFITLSDFRSSSFLTGLAYAWLWFMAMVAVAVYSVDTFTAVNLLAFNKWSSSVQPAVPFRYSRWIFAACILFSWVLCFYEWVRAIRVIRRGGVAESYMDPLAAILQSMRGQGWKRFLVFSELTKSKKGADYVALFTYFAFQGAVRVVLAEGPRQAVNAMTLYAVLQADVLPSGHVQHPAVIQFFLNIQALADKNIQQTVVYSSMLFTLVIWVFSALSLIAATVLYLVFLWHYIPQRDGRLSIYCRRKIDRRLEKIVEHKIKAALEEEERKQKKAERKAELKRQKTGEFPLDAPKPALVRQPTLPQISDSAEHDPDEKIPGLTRHDTNSTMSTLPPYDGRAATRNGSMDHGRPGMGSRMDTNASGWSNSSYASNAPLLANAGHTGYGGENNMASIPPSYNRQDSTSTMRRPMPGRNMSQSTQGSQMPFSPVSRMDSPAQDRAFSPAPRDGPMAGRDPRRGPPPARSNTATTFDQQSMMDGRLPGPLRQNTASPYGPPPRQNTASSFGPPSRQNTASPFGPPSRQNTGTPFAPPSRQNTGTPFAPPSRQYTASPLDLQHPEPGVGSTDGPLRSYGPPSRQNTFEAYSPQAGGRNSPAPTIVRPTTTTPAPTTRSFSRPGVPRDPTQTKPSYVPDSYEMTAQPPRSASTAPPSAGGYVAFNPSKARTTTPAPATRTPSPGEPVAVVGRPGTEDNYFGHVTPAPQDVHESAESGHAEPYDDILDDYDSAPSAGLEEPSPSHYGGPIRR